MLIDHPAVIALGSNQGDREHYLREAVAALKALPGVQVTAVSRVYETPALRLSGVDENAPSYLNAVALVRSVLPPEMLLGSLHGIEASLGRVREERWGDRTIDLDLVDYDGTELETESITLPHPRAHERGFVLKPWLDVNPDAVLVGFGKVSDLLARTTDKVALASSIAPLDDTASPTESQQVKGS
ncbi:MAG: 2-amino-4-hydroxy-6-hydroxymethyldihydropteridine diphosphokinase [Microbacteriaceae bacterium]|nr:2-amino-4-hydroxy-6-hydroxymethyldihydropteridine diphosphokinase [Microbacteriaceae bacterium]